MGSWARETGLRCDAEVQGRNASVLRRGIPCRCPAALPAVRRVYRQRPPTVCAVFLAAALLRASSLPAWLEHQNSVNTIDAVLWKSQLHNRSSSGLAVL